MQLYIENISCSGCAKGVTASILAIDAQAKVEVDVSTKLVQVESTAPVEAITSALTEDGFPPVIKG